MTNLSTQIASIITEDPDIFCETYADELESGDIPPQELFADLNREFRNTVQIYDELRDIAQSRRERIPDAFAVIGRVLEAVRDHLDEFKTPNSSILNKLPRMIQAVREISGDRIIDHLGMGQDNARFMSSGLHKLDAALRIYLMGLKGILRNISDTEQL